MDYKPGQIAASLNQGKTKSGAGNPLLAQLFSDKKEKSKNKKTDQTDKKVSKKKLLKTTKAEITQDLSAPSDVKGKKGGGGKRKNEEPLATTKTKKAKKELNSSESTNQSNNDASVNGFPFVHESLLGQTHQSTSKKGKEDKKKQDILDEEETLPLSRRRRRRDKTADKRTIFIGNCPLSTDKKVMIKLFKDFGAIESTRFRCGPAAQLDLPRRAVIIKKEFHENASSYVCYLVFKEEEAAQKALQMNGHVLDGLHLRVDLASNHKKHDKKRSVFVGNLPFTVSEEDLRNYFQDCGDIGNVRIIRDRQTSIGKGIAYVQFETKDGVTLAKKLNESDFQGRKLRVMTCTNKPVNTANNSQQMKRKALSKPITHPEKKKIVFAPSNRKSPKSFHEILQAKKEKRLNKMKKKKQGSQKSDGLSSIFGDMPADMKKLKTSNPRLREKKDKKQKDKRKEKMKNKKMKNKS